MTSSRPDLARLLAGVNLPTTALVRRESLFQRKELTRVSPFRQSEQLRKSPFLEARRALPSWQPSASVCCPFYQTHFALEVASQYARVSPLMYSEPVSWRNIMSQPSLVWDVIGLGVQSIVEQVASLTGAKP